jgi:membrane protein DedA with SNARE-associated domain
VTEDEQAVAPAVPRSGPYWLGAFVVLLVAANFASVVWSSLLRDHPWQLLALSARNRYLVLTVPSTLGPLRWATLAVVRLGASALVCHAIGRCYGDRALRWFWRFLGMPQQQVAKFEQQVARAEWIVVPFFVGSNIVWALTGAAGTSWRRLAPMFVVGTTARLALLWWLSKEFEGTLRRITDWTNRYQLPIVGISLVIVLATNIRNFRSGR